MRFQDLRWLLLLPLLIGVVLVVARSGRRAVPRRQFRIAVVLRGIGVTLLVVALTQPTLVLSSNQRSVLFLLDRSASIDAGARDAQEDYLAAALEAASAEDLAGVAVFGRDLRMDAALAAGRTAEPVRAVADGSATDLAGALRAAAAVLPTEGSRRIVVLTDGVETLGNARAAAVELADAGIALDIVVLETGRGKDALVDAVSVPATAREGDSIPVEVVVRSTESGPGVVTIEAGGETYEFDIDLVPGRNVIELDIPAAESGGLRVTASIATDFDRVPENDRAEGIVRVLGPARVAVVEGREGEGVDLAAALEAAGINVDLRPDVPTPEDLIVYDGVVLVNVPGPSSDVAADLSAFVEDLGRGLVAIGGDRSFGLGNYQLTDLEEILPVRSDPEDMIRQIPIAEVLVIDTSGSMAACHAREEDSFQYEGVVKTDIAKAGALQAIEALRDQDRVGVLAFTSGTRWALPFDSKPDPTTLATALNTLTPEGDTEIAPALREALETLKSAEEQIRHIVLFTDGWASDEFDLLNAAQEIADAGVTMSVLGTGEGSGDTLRRMAAIAGGQFYPGRDLEEVPEIFVEETMRVARPLIAEGVFLPVLGVASQVTAGLTSAPPLLGYVLTREKGTAQMALTIGPGDPLLATWQRGLGRAAAWTSDAFSRWSSEWIAWEGFVDFWGRLVRDVLPPGTENPPEVRLAGGSLTIDWDVAVPLDAIGIAQVRNPDGEVVAIPLQRVGETEFSAVVPVSGAGAYWVAATIEGTDGILATGSSGVVAGYSDEFAFRDPDTNLALDLADATGGRVSPLAARAFDLTATRGAAPRPLWPWLVGLALALFLIDVALRRLIVARSDLTAWKQALAPATREPVAALETTAAGEVTAPEEREIHPEEETLGRLLRRKRG